LELTSSLLPFERTNNLADQFPQLLDEVTVENKNLVIQRTLPLPNKLYEQLLLAVVEGTEEEYQSYWKQPSSVTLDKIEKFLAYQSQVWS
jgi:hypothetical protein